MSQDYSEYLAVNVLNEQQYVSYRNLSRALKVHSNLAKQMLYEFHRKQNSKKPGSVHATYLITGTKHPAQTNGVHNQEDGEGSIMRSSPPLPSSSMPRPEEETEEVVAVRSIMLVKEEHLEQAKALFETTTGMHIYSLQSNSISDVQTLTECNRKVAAEYASEDPLKEWKQYGTIQNANVKRRTKRSDPPPPNPTAAKSDPVKQKAVAAAAKSSAAELQQADSKASPKNATPEPSKSTASKSTTGKGKDSNIFKSFAKGAAKPKKTDSQSSAAPSPPTPAEREDVPMAGFSDDDDDEADSGLPEELDDVKAPTGKSKKDRAAELKAMMEQEDEPMEDAVTTGADDEEHDDGAIDKAEPEQKEEPRETMTVENGRRRGRRRVMKKKTVKDEEGYLVTREEPVWEEFSEDEPAPKKPKVQVAAPTNKPGSKTAGKPGQGNIMSFFNKK